MKVLLLAWFLTSGVVSALAAASKVEQPPETTPGDAQLKRYFELETAVLANSTLTDLTTREAWEEKRVKLRAQLQEMLGLSPMPEKTDLKPTITGRLDHGDFIVEKLHYQSLPQLYVTANLYLPKNLTKPAPAILYVCGHGQVKSNGVSFGNKTSYQHHGEWFARHGYVCLTIDTIQLGEIEGHHHGTHRLGMWWWNSRGYTPAGVEAWNGIRGIDYLQSRPEVDGSRIGVTGRSGGGAYSWWVASLDERVKVAAPVAGITDLQNHVVDGVVQGHCDCMFMVNTYRWDYAQVAALVAPRPLLICNTDKDKIFPLDGVMRVHGKVRDVYRLYDAETNLGVLITEGPHKDTQDLQVPVFRWFDRFLKGEQPLITVATEKLYTPAELKVFAKLPADERVTKIHESFVPSVPAPKAPENATAWETQRSALLGALLDKSFRGWPVVSPVDDLREAFRAEQGKARMVAAEFNSQDEVRLRFYGLAGGKGPYRRVVLQVLDEEKFPVWLALMRSQFGSGFDEELEVQQKIGASKPDDAAVERLKSEVTGWLSDPETAVAFFAPRGFGMDAWNPPVKTRQHVARRFMLLGQTIDGMRAWDIRRLVEVLHGIEAVGDASIEIHASGNQAVNALYAAITSEGVERLVLSQLPASHRTGPDYLNVLRVLDIPTAVAMAGDRMEVELRETDRRYWSYPIDVANKLGWGQERLTVK